MRNLRNAAAAAIVAAGLLGPNLFAAGASVAAEAPRPPPEVERSALSRLRKAGATEDALAQGEGLFRPVRLSGAATPDWLVDYAAVPLGRLCGTGGCPLQVWAATPGGRYRVVLDRQVLGHAVSDTPPALRLELHGVHCGGTGSDPCVQHFAWRDGRLARTDAARGR